MAPTNRNSSLLHARRPTLDHNQLSTTHGSGRTSVPLSISVGLLGTLVSLHGKLLFSGTFPRTHRGGALSRGSPCYQPAGRHRSSGSAHYTGAAICQLLARSLPVR